MVLNSVSQIRKNEDLKNSINMYKFNKNEKTDTNMITDNLKIDGEKSAFSSLLNLYVLIEFFKSSFFLI